MTKICLSVSHPEDLRAAGAADMIELRLDMLECIPNELPNLPFIATLGGLKGERRWSAANEAIRRGAILIDVGEEDVPFILPEWIMFSHHDWERTPPHTEIIRQMDRLQSRVRKAAFMVNRFRDLVSIYRASQSIEYEHIILGMGEIGGVTRLRPKVLGNLFTFGHGGHPTAPGQFHVEEMKRLGPDAMILGIVGRPLGHTASPAMHHAALSAMDIRGKYLRFDVPDIEELSTFMLAYSIRGLNVTIPYKVQVIEQMDELDPSAAAVGAVNTICNEEGKIVGYNTDVEGALRALINNGVDPARSHALIIGAGGAAMACCYAISSAGGEVTVTNRDMNKAYKLAERFQCHTLEAPRSLDDFDLIINCTPLGMQGFPSSAPIDTAMLHEGHTVFDLVYRPRDTPLIREASYRGAKTISGIDMLVHQALASFYIWTGKNVDPKVMMEALV
ncbi:MAG: hypothetical protein PWQ88_123 [Candidatus Methanomethylophilaceae archaeon]|nr:hypothetical protein [Candidatus Methanomethylophilaceae archaeon]HIJ00961.1 shikimate dehydrogenase [Candidatus Methanomethylophilaceae archaeon]